MAVAVQITLAICGTLVLIVCVLAFSDRGSGHRWGRSERLGLYSRFLAALADVKSDPSNRGAWQRLSSAAHAISLAASPEVVSSTLACCREMRERQAPPDASVARTLLLMFRKDLGIHPVGGAETLDFDVVPSGPARPERPDEGGRSGHTRGGTATG